MFGLIYTLSQSTPTPSNILFNLSNSLDIINGDYYDMKLTDKQQAYDLGIFNEDYLSYLFNLPIYTNGKGCYIFYSDMSTKIISGNFSSQSIPYFYSTRWYCKFSSSFRSILSK